MKLTKSIIISGILLCGMVSLGNAQGLTQEQKNTLITNLANYDSAGTINSPLTSVRMITEYNIVEAIPSLVQNIWKQRPEIQFEFLRGLQKLGAEETHALTLSFLDSVDKYNYDNNIFWKLYYKAAANEILFKMNDYSKRNYLYEMFDKYRYAIEGLATTLFALILNHVPEDELKVKGILLKIVDESLDENNRYFAVRSLHRKYGILVLPLVKQRFIVETEPSVRLVYLDKILSKYKSNENHSFLLNQVANDSSDYIRSEILKNLLIIYGSPFDLKYVTQNKGSLRSPYQSFCNMYLKYFATVKPDSNLGLKNILDSLISYHRQCVSFNWLGDQSFSNQLYLYLVNANTKYVAGDSISAAFSVRHYRSIINKVYLDTLKTESKYVTKNAYIFLHYYPMYILQKLPKVPWIESITPEVTVRKSSEFQITISGSDFKSDATVLWNNTTQKIISVTDTLIRVEIDKKESNKKGIYNLTVKNPDGIISNEAAFEITNKLEFSVNPVLECVRKNDDGSYTAYFGYDNKNNRSVLLQVGEENKFDPSEHDRLQPEIFMPGRHKNIFNVKFDGEKIMWKLNKEKITADKDSPECK